MNLQLLKNINFYPRNILDIGCNVGLFHKECVETWGNAFDCFLIDGNPNVESYIQSITQNYKICILSDTIKEVNWYGTRENNLCTGDSYYRENTKHYNDENAVISKKTTDTLDNMFKDYSSFDLIKIDTQGSEIDIMNGGLNLCKRSQFIILEVSLMEYNKNAPLKDTVVNFMKSINFEAFDTLDKHYLNGSIFQEDIVFKNMKEVE